MEDFAAMLSTAMKLLQIEFTIWGFAFSYWQIMLFGMAASIIIWFLWEVFRG